MICRRSRELGFLEIAKLSDYIPNLQFHSLIVDSRWAEANSQLTVRYLKAMVRSMQWAHANHEQAAELVSKRTGIPLKSTRVHGRRIFIPGHHQSRRVRQPRGFSAVDRFDGRAPVQEQALSCAGKISRHELPASCAAGVGRGSRPVDEEFDRLPAGDIRSKQSLPGPLSRRRGPDLGVIGPALQDFEYAVLNQRGHFLGTRDLNISDTVARVLISLFISSLTSNSSCKPKRPL